MESILNSIVTLILLLRLCIGKYNLNVILMSPNTFTTEFILCKINIGYLLPLEQCWDGVSNTATKYNGSWTIISRSCVKKRKIIFHLVHVYKINDNLNIRLTKWLKNEERRGKGCGFPGVGEGWRKGEGEVISSDSSQIIFLTKQLIFTNKKDLIANYTIQLLLFRKFYHSSFIFINFIF